MRYGKLDPHSEETHPRVHLRDHLTSASPPPVVVDWASRIPMWPMYMNNRIGDCTCAAIGHAVQAWTAYGQGQLLTLPDTDILDLYEAVSGYDPATGENDHGAIGQDVLEHIQKNGVGGHHIVAFAQVDHKNLSEMKTALDIFGTVYLGIQVPQSAEDQFSAGQPWTLAPGSPIIGGHAIDLQKWDADFMYPVTWAKLQPMTEDFWLAYGDEAWVIITEDWIGRNGTSPLGIDLHGLIAEFNGLTGQPDAPVIKKTGCPVINWLKRFLI